MLEPIQRGIQRTRFTSTCSEISPIRRQYPSRGEPLYEGFGGSASRASSEADGCALFHSVWTSYTRSMSRQSTSTQMSQFQRGNLGLLGSRTYTTFLIDS